MTENTCGHTEQMERDSWEKLAYRQEAKIQALQVENERLRNALEKYKQQSYEAFIYVASLLLAEDESLGEEVLDG